MSDKTIISVLKQPCNASCTPCEHNAVSVTVIIVLVTLEAIRSFVGFETNGNNLYKIHVNKQPSLDGACIESHVLVGTTNSLSILTTKAYNKCI